MYKTICIFLFAINLSLAFSQKVEKENLTQKVKLFWDKGNKKIQATGSYYTNERRGNTTEKHGKWLFYSFDGILEEERNYYRNRIHGLQTIYYPNKKIKQQTYFTFNVPDSAFKEWNENGILIILGNYDLGSPDGIWEYYYDNGKKKSVEEVIKDSTYLRSFFENDSLHTQTIKDGDGFIKSLYTNGLAKELYTFKNGLKTGLFEERTANGMLSISGYFNDGKKDSIWEFYSFLGKLEKKITYKNDTLDGEYLVYYKDQSINTKGYYIKGKKTGEWTWNFSNGKPEIIGSFKNGMQHGKWFYYFNNGQTSYTANFNLSKKDGEWVYYSKDGAIEKKGTYFNDEKNGLWETWYETGAKLMTGNYKNGKEEGEWSNFWENNVLKNKAAFKKGQLNGKWYSYNPENVLVCSGKYKNGLKVSTWIDYFNNGEIKEISNYKIFRRKNNINNISIVGMKTIQSEYHGEFQTYSQIDFKQKTIGKYKNGLKEGTWFDYYPGGLIPTSISNYKNGKLHGVFKQIGRRGEPLFEINYKKGIKDGWFVVYDSNGKEKVRKMFKNGREQMKQNNENYFSP